MSLAALALALLASPAPAAPAPAPGFADYHLHQLSDLAFGGRYLWGKHDGPEDKALPHCSGTSFDGHGIFAGEEGGGGNLKPHAKDGYPQFHAWPHWNSTSHQQAHADWLERAHKAGMTLVVVSALNQNTFCEMIPAYLRDPHASCDDFHAVVAQLEAAHAFAKKHPWYAVVKSPAEARAAIAQGKLAVVLAVEAGDVLGGGRDWKQRLEKLHALGVRSFQPVHEINNRFSGAAWHATALKVLQTEQNMSRELGDVEKFVETAVTMLKGNVKHNAQNLAKEAAAIRKHGQALIGFDLDAHKLNKLGLSREGEELVDELVKLQMLVDVAHMSQKALHQTAQLLAKRGHYPIFNSHAHVRELVAPGEITEWTYPAEVLDLVAQSGGVTGLRSAAAEMRPVSGSPVPNDCHGSTKSFAQKVFFTSALMQLEVGFATDFNGWAENLMPRFGAAGETCAATPLDAEGKAQAKHQRDRSGSPLDSKGFAHIGLIGNVLQELKRLGAPTDKLEHSTESFLKMWERALDVHRPALSRKPLAGAAVRHIGHYPTNAQRVAAIKHLK